MPRIRKEPELEQEPDTIEAVAEPVVAVMEPPMPAAKPVAVLERRVETMELAVPLGEIGPGYCSPHVQVFLDASQAETMQRLVVGLRDRRETTTNGREVRSAADAVRWLLEQIGC
jgi:hypothetical protein